MDADKTPVENYIPATTALKRIGLRGGGRGPEYVQKLLSERGIRYLPPRVAGKKTFILVNVYDVEMEEARLAEAIAPSLPALELPTPDSTDVLLQRIFDVVFALEVKLDTLASVNRGYQHDFNALKDKLKDAHELISLHVNGPHRD